MKREIKDLRYPDLPRDEFINKFWEFLLDTFYYPILLKIRNIFLNFENPLYRGILLRGFYGERDWFFKVGNKWLEFLVRRGNLYDLLFQFHISGWICKVYNFCVNLVEKSYFWFIVFNEFEEFYLDDDKATRTPYYYFRFRKTYDRPPQNVSSWIVYNERDFRSVYNFFTWTLRSFTPIEILYEFTLDIGEPAPPFGGLKGKEHRKTYIESRNSILGFSGDFISVNV